MSNDKRDIYWCLIDDNGVCILMEPSAAALAAKMGTTENTVRSNYTHFKNQGVPCHIRKVEDITDEEEFEEMSDEELRAEYGDDFQRTDIPAFREQMKKDEEEYRKSPEYMEKASAWSRKFNQIDNYELGK